MSSSIQLGRPLVYFNSQPIDSSALATTSQSPEDQIAAFEADSLARADHLSLHQQAAYKSHVRAFVNDLRMQISRMRALGSDALQIHSEITKTISQYDLSLKTLYTHNAAYHSDKQKVEEQNRATLQQIRGAKVNFTPFSPKRTQTAPLTPETRISRATISRSLDNMDMREHLLDVRIAANLVEKVSEVVVDAAKAVCSVTDTTKQACKSTLDFAARSGIATLEATGTKEMVKQVVLYLQTCEGSNLAEVLADRYSFAPEEAKKVARQYVKDVGVIATLPAGYGTASLALKAVKPLVAQAVKGAKTLLGRVTVAEAEHVVSSAAQSLSTSTVEAECAASSYISTNDAIAQRRLTLLYGPSPGFQAFVQAENRIQQQLSQPYRHFKIHANRYPKVPYSEVPRHPDVYFHATSLDRAFGILKSSSIKRFDKSYYLGTFVSTNPEFLMGDAVLAFNRSIERVSEVLNAYFEGGRHWAGFSRAIPVTSESLEYIAVKADLLAKEPIEALAKQLSAAAGREIPVVPLEPIVEMIERRALQEGVFVPEEWPISMKVINK